MRVRGGLVGPPSSLARGASALGESRHRFASETGETTGLDSEKSSGGPPPDRGV